MSPRSPVPAPWLLIALPATVLLVFFVLPNALLLSASFLKSEAQQLTAEPTLDNYRFLLSRPLYLAVFFRTFVVGLAVAAIDVALGYPLAYFLVRTRSRWKGLLIALSLAPLLASVVVRTGCAGSVMSRTATPAFWPSRTCVPTSNVVS